MSQDVFGENPWPTPANVEIPDRASFRVQVARLLSLDESAVDQWDAGYSTIEYAWDTETDCYHE